MEKSLYDMLDVSSTMLITLYARARESQQKDPILHDAKAVEMIEIIKREVRGSANPIHRRIVKDQYNSMLSVSMALRSRRFDRYVNDFLQRSPNGTVINMGCGLDTRFDRIDNGQVTWFDIDFPEVIELRKRFMSESERRHFIAGSILDPGWTELVKTGGPYLVLAEGVFMYLHEADVKNLLALIHAELGRAELVCEVTNRYWVDKMQSKWMQFKFKNQLGMTGGATFSFGVPDSRYFEQWDPSYHFLDEWTYFDDKEHRLGMIYALAANFEMVRKVQWTMHYTIGE